MVVCGLPACRDKYHSAIDFFMAYHRLGFKQALRMGGDTDAEGFGAKAGKEKPVTNPRRSDRPRTAWQADAWADQRQVIL
jgi:hypothetical protein